MTAQPDTEPQQLGPRIFFDGHALLTGSWSDRTLVAQTMIPPLGRSRRGDVHMQQGAAQQRGALEPSRATQRTWVGIALAALLLGACLSASTGTAWGLPPGCTQTGQTVTCTYRPPGVVSFTVPSGLVGVNLQAVGGTGGGQSDPRCEPLCGGEGASVSANVGVSTGEILFLAHKEVNAIDGSCSLDGGALISSCGN
jgi:hypothetical protein